MRSDLYRGEEDVRAAVRALDDVAPKVGEPPDPPGGYSVALRRLAGEVGSPPDEMGGVAVASSRDRSALTVERDGGRRVTYRRGVLAWRSRAGDELPLDVGDRAVERHADEALFSAFLNLCGNVERAESRKARN